MKQGIRVSAMAAELRAIDLADAQRELKLYRCEGCRRLGQEFYDGRWLCAFCRARASMRLEKRK